MKPIQGFWLLVIALFVPSALGHLGLYYGDIYLIGDGALALLMLISVFSATENRLAFLASGIALASIPLGSLLMNLGNSFGWLVLIMLTLSALSLGFSAFSRRQRGQRAGVILVLLSCLALDFWGSIDIGTILVIIGVVGGVAVLLGFFGILAQGFASAGEEDARLLAEGKPPKHGPPPFGPNNPFS